MKKFLKSRYQFPTRVVMGSDRGRLVIGSIDAKLDVERNLGRKLHEDTKTVKRGGNWVFIEPSVPASK